MRGRFSSWICVVVYDISNIYVFNWCQCLIWLQVFKKQQRFHRILIQIKDISAIIIYPDLSPIEDVHWSFVEIVPMFEAFSISSLVPHWKGLPWLKLCNKTRKFQVSHLASEWDARHISRKCRTSNIRRQYYWICVLLICSSMRKSKNMMLSINGNKPFHSKIDDYHSTITLQSTTDYLVREAISIGTKHLTNTHMSTVQKNKKASLSIVNEGHKRPQEWSGESAEPWACACLLSVLTHSARYFSGSFHQLYSTKRSLLWEPSFQTVGCKSMTIEVIILPFLCSLVMTIPLRTTNYKAKWYMMKRRIEHTNGLSFQYVDNNVVGSSINSHGLHSIIHLDDTSGSRPWSRVKYRWFFCIIPVLICI